MSHTPAPWRVDGCDFLRAEDGATLATLHTWANDTLDAREEAKANARLIAAAPELLEALEQCVSWLHDAAPMHVGQEARAAIAKANGETK